MRILIIHNFYSQYGGEDAVVNDQIKLLERNGHIVLKYFRYSSEISDLFLGKFRSLISALYNPKSVNDIKKLISTQKPDLVLIHNLYPLISPSILPFIKREKIPIVMIVHNYRLICPNGLFFTNNKTCESCTDRGKEFNCIKYNCEDSYLKSIGYALRNWWARKKKYYMINVDAFVCLTNFQKNKLVANGFPSNNIYVLPNMFQGDIPNHPIITKTDFNSYVAFVGRISPEKGIDLIFKAAKMLPSIRFKLAGRIKEGFILPEIPENIEMVGMLDSIRLNKFYSKASIYVQSSNCYEGFPMVLPEAMNHFLPIIAPRMAGFTEIVEHKTNGLLFEPGNAKDLAKQIYYLYQNPKIASEYGKNGFLKLQKLYTPKVYYLNLLTIFKHFINRKN